MRIAIVALLLMAACRAPEFPAVPPARATIRQNAATLPPPAPATALDTTQPLRVGGDVKPPVIVNRTDPEFSPECRKHRYTTTLAIAEAVITREGVVKNIRLLKRGDTCLDAALVKSLQRWKFKPATLHGQPVDCIYNLTMTVHLR